jgi:hypothetical protein
VSISTGSNFDPNNTNVWNNNFCLDLEVCTLGDVNGDGRDDLIAFLRGTQGIVFAGTSTGSSFSGGVIWHNNFCYGNETCAVGDINNDGMDDILAFSHSLYDASRHGEIWTATSTGSGFNASQLPYTGFCLGNSVCMSGDFNGDGWDDAIAFLRNAFSGDSAGDVEVQLFP